MEPPPKRTRVGHAPWDDDDDEEANDDELALSAGQFSARQDPMYQLDKKRAKSALKLKSRFEDIFAKYGQDFEGVGDEINLHTGEIVVNNGHLESLEDENPDKLGDEGEEAELSQDKSKIQPSRPVSLLRPGPALCRPPQMLQNGRQQPPGPIHNFVPAPPLFGLPAPPLQHTGAVDPAWQTPEMELPSIQYGVGSVTQSEFSSWSNHGWQHAAAGTGFGIGYGTLGMLSQPYRRITTVKEIGPRAHLGLGTDGEDKTHTSDDQDDEDTLIGTSKDFAKPVARPHRRILAGAGPSPAAQLEQAAKMRGHGKNSKLLEDKDRTKCRRGRPRKQPTSTSRAAKVIDVPGLNLVSTAVAPHENDVSPTRAASKRNSGGKKGLEVTTGSQAMSTKIKEQKTVTDESSDSLSRRSTRTRPEIQRYDQIDWKRPTQGRPHVVRAVTPPEDTDSDSSNHPGSPQSSESVSALRREQSDLVHATPDEDDIESDHPNVAYGCTQLPPQPSEAARNSDCAEEASTPAAEAPTSSLPRLTTAEPQAPSCSPPNSTSNDEIGVAELAAEQTVAIEEEIEEIKQNVNITVEFLDEDESVDLFESAPRSVKLPDGNERSTDMISSRVCTPELDASAIYEDGNDSDVSVELGESISSKAASPKGAVSAQEHNLESARIRQPEIVIGLEDNDTEATEPTSISTSPLTRVLRPRQSHRNQLTTLPLRPSTKQPFLSPRLEPFEKPQAESVPVRESSVSPASIPPPVLRSSSSKRSPNKSHPRTPRKIRTLASLVPDAHDDDAELSVLSSSVARTPTSNASFRASFLRGESHTPSYVRSSPHQSHQHSVLVSTPPHINLSRASSRHASPALPKRPHTDNKAIRYGLKRKQSTSGLALSSPLARNVLLRSPQKSTKRHTIESSRAGPSAEDAVQTPGGTVKRCGKNGFMCGREFCFTCCE